MLGTAEVKTKTQEALKPIAEAFASVGVKPNFITVLGFLFSVVSGISLAFGNFLVGTLFFVFSGICDLMDGILARVAGKASPFGAFLDSFLDRYSDFFPLFGIAVLAFEADDLPLFVFTLFTVAGSFATSYARARAESLGADCRSGVVERPERFFFVLAGLISGYLTLALGFLAVLSNATAVQRLVCAMEKLKR
jgi:phosphatidylglycerophosphate synthase